VLGSRDRRYNYDYNTFARLTSLTDQNNNQIVSYGYDARGNMTNDGATQLTFDLADTVTRVQVGSVIEDYLYDASGQTRYPVYTMDGLLRAEYGAQTETYYYLGSQLIARTRMGQRLDLIISTSFEALIGSTAMGAIKRFFDKAAKNVVTN